MKPVDSQRGSALVEVLVSVALVALVALAGAAIVAARSVVGRATSSDAVRASVLAAELTDARAAASYDGTIGSALVAGTSVITPEPLPTGVALASALPTAIPVSASPVSAAGSPQLVLAVPRASAAPLSGAIDMVQAIPARGATIAVAAPTPIAQPTATATP
jgi:type II secretory pathway pseudopilin PulG